MLAVADGRAQLRVREQGIDEIDDRRRRAPGPVQRQNGRAQPLLQPAGGGTQQLRVGAAEAVDALLGVADDEGAAAAAGVAGGHLLQQRQQQAPLGRTGVLELVEQQVIDALVQAVADPLGIAVRGQQAVSAPFQVGEAERPLRRQLGVQGLQRRHAQGQGRAGALQAGPVQTVPAPGFHRGHHLVAALLHMLHFGFAEPLALGDADTELVGLAVLGEQGGQQPLVARLAFGVERGFHALGFDMADTAQPVQPAPQHLQPGGEGVGVERHRLALALRRGQPLLRIGQWIGLAFHVGPPVGAMGDEAVHQPLELVLAMAGSDQLAQGPRRRRFRLAVQARQQAAPGAAAQGALVLHQVEAGLHASFQGETRQQVLAEGVQGQRAGRIGLEQHAVVEPAGLFQLPGLAFQPQVTELCQHLGLAAIGQAVQALVDALAHLGRRLAGESEGQDAAGRMPLQQQAQHARGEQPGLAAAGGRRHRGIAARIQGRIGRGERSLSHANRPCGTGRGSRSARSWRHRPGPAWAPPG